MAATKAHTEIEEREPSLNDYVKIKLPKYKDNAADVFVSVNDYTAQIKRGVVVEVPRFIAEVLERSAEQDERTADMIARMERDDI